MDPVQIRPKKEMKILDDYLLCDIEMLLNGGFAPLTGFLNEDQYHQVLDEMRIRIEGKTHVWTMPICLPVSGEASYQKGEEILLIDSLGRRVATLTIESVYVPDLENEFTKVFGCGSDLGANHPYIQRLVSLQKKWGTVLYLGGALRAEEGVFHVDFLEHRISPQDMREWVTSEEETMIGFQTRNPLHNCHLELIRRALRQVPKAHVFLNPVVGVSQPGDIPYSVRLKCYKGVLGLFPPGKVHLVVLPLAMRMAGPREAVWHAAIRRNYGCSYFVVGRDHAGPSIKRTDGEPFFDPYAAQKLARSVEAELGISFLTCPMICYVPGIGQYLTPDEKHPEEPTQSISGSKLRAMLREGKTPPFWFSPPQVLKILQRHYQGGICVYLTGLSGAGKSTLAELLQRKIQESCERKVTILDGDVVRTNLSAGLGFSKEDRSKNVRRIGYVANEIVKHGGIVICANIAPFQDDRMANRALISEVGTYIQVYLTTSLEVCEKRDVKGLYAQVRAGELKNFTGIDSPYERPTLSEMGDDDLVLNAEASLEKTLGNLWSHLTSYL